MKRLYIVTGIIALLFVSVSAVSVYSIQKLQGNARVINYCGIVRGATQKLIKEELNRVNDDSLMGNLDTIVENLRTGEGTHDLIILNDAGYKDSLNSINDQWKSLKQDIYNYRDNPTEENKQKLFNASENYFKLANDTVFIAEKYAETQVNFLMALLIGIIIVFLVILVLGLLFVQKGGLKEKKEDTPDKVASLDPLTQINNRASCDQLIDKVKASPSYEDMAVIIFNMNNMKMANNALGHKGGDRLIMQFAHILKNVARSYGFVGRYGGDEFLSIIPRANEHSIRSYFRDINIEVRAYNSQQKDDMRRISFAMGYYIGKSTQTNIDDMIYEAYKSMYENKHEMKNGTPYNDYVE